LTLAFFLMLALANGTPAAAQTTADVVYGQGGSFTTNAANNGGISANSLYDPSGVALDSSGNLYVADDANSRVLFYPSGSTSATRVYGQGGSFTTNNYYNGAVSANSLANPFGVALDSSGNLYVADAGNNRVLFYPSGSTSATRVYGQGGSFTTNTPNNGGISANSLDHPFGVALDSSGNLYVADAGSNRVLFYPSGSTTATRVYGQGGSFTTGTANNGGVSANSLYVPFGVPLDSSGNLYVADDANSRVLFYPAGSTTATRVYGQGGSFTTNTTNKGGISANSLYDPDGPTLDSSGNLYVVDTYNSRALFYPSGSTTATRVYGQGGSFTTNTANNGGISANILSYAPIAVALDSSGNLYVADTGNNRVLEYPARTAADTVTSLADDGSLGTLRSVMTAAASGDTIVFSVTGTITLTQGYLEISRNLTISGPGAANLAISGNNVSTVLYVDGGVTATVSGVTIENGSGNADANGDGGGIFNNGTLTVNNSTISSNYVSGGSAGGGGIANIGTLTLSNSTLSGNHANTNASGAGIYNAGTATVINSTFSGNHANLFGGGIQNNGPLTMSNSTLSGNVADYSAGGIRDGTGGTMTLKSTLLAGNIAAYGGNCSGTLTSDGYNLDDDGTCGLNQLTDQSDIATAASYLGPLQNNGGPTQTIALLTGSTAIDAIPVSECTDAFGNPVTTDQRGISRPQGAGCDIGAYELTMTGIYSPVNHSTLSGNPVTFKWSGYAGATAYWLDVGKEQGGNEYYSSGNLGTVLFQAVTLPTNGSTIYVRWYYYVNGGWQYVDYTYTAWNGIPNGDSAATMSSPVAPGPLSGSSATFYWAAGTGATAYWLDIGSAAGGNNYYSSGSLSPATLSAAANGLPTNGSNVYVTLYTQFSGSGQWVENSYTYTAFNASAGAGVLTTPTPTSTLTGSTVTFGWNAGSAPPTGYWLDIGGSAGGNNYYSSGNLGNVLTTTVSGLPTDGSTVYVTLYSLVSGVWLSNAYTYTAFNLAAAAGILTTPTPGSTLTSNTVAFDWTAGSGASAYWMDIGSTTGGNNYYSSGNLGTALTTTVSRLPTDGSEIFVTLYSLIGGTWSGNAYTYTALNATGSLAAMQTPTPGATISGTSATFTWSSDVNATAYWVDIGSTVGGNNVYSSGNLSTALTTTVYTLPANSTTIYVSLYSYVGGQWVNNPVTYTSGP
jgi:hypothetical protein